MPVAPLFVASIEDLKARLRLTGATKSDFSAQLDLALEDVRLGFYDEDGGLGTTRVGELLAISYVENATNATSLLRTRANNLEVTWVRLLLMRRLPTLFMDAGGETLDAWNEEPITRSSRRGLESEIQRLENEVTDGLAYLGGADEEDLGEVAVTVFEPEITPDLPRASILPYTPRLD